MQATVTMPRRYLHEQTESKLPLTESIMEAIGNGHTRQAEILLHHYINCVEDHTDLDDHVRTITWRRPLFSWLTAPRYLSSLSAARDLIYEALPYSPNATKTARQLISGVLAAASKKEESYYHDNFFKGDFEKHLCLDIIMAFMEQMRGTSK